MQIAHVADATTAAAVPAAQVVHVVEPPVEYVPTAHVAHCWLLVRLSYVPAGQLEQLADPGAEDKPMAHATHAAETVAPVKAPYVPVAHLVQSAVAVPDPKVPEGQGRQLLASASE